MSKNKRRAPKKHRIDPSHLGQGPQAAAPKATVKSSQSVVNDVNSTAFVGVEVRKVLLLAALFIGLEVVLWIVFTHTGIGDTIYRTVKP